MSIGKGQRYFSITSFTADHSKPPLPQPSLGKAIAVALKAGNRIAHPKEPTIGHYEFTFNGARVIKGKFGYFCSAKKDTGCPFSLGKEYCGKAISDAQAIRLIEKGKTALIKGFKKKDGKGEFDAYLVVDKTAKKIKFEFPAKKK